MCKNSRKQNWKDLNNTYGVLVTKRIVSQIEAQHCRLESLYPVFKDASIKRFVEQNRANSLCFVRNFFLGGGGEGSIAVG